MAELRKSVFSVPMMGILRSFSVNAFIQDWPANRVRDLLPWKVDLTSQ
ncbi:hypothetical protein EC2851500_5095 [Escherichia coli 2851500]|nr:hypothetical protein EC2851500_5095 [Escherichia coli 2851500]